MPSCVDLQVVVVVGVLEGQSRVGCAGGLEVVVGVLALLVD